MHEGAELEVTILELNGEEKICMEFELQSHHFTIEESCISERGGVDSGA